MTQQFPRELKQIFKQNLYENIQSNNISGSLKVQTTQYPSTDSDKPNLICLYDGILLDYKKECSTDTCYTVGNLKNIMLNDEARHKIPPVVWFYLHEIPEIGR